MSPSIQRLLFGGDFPVYCYMYTLRPFMRLNGVTQERIERFVQAVAGKGLSVRDIELLAHGYFRGPASLQEAIEGGRLVWSLERMKSVPEDLEGCNQRERVLLNDLQILHKYMQRVMTKCDDRRLQSRAFCAQANLLAGGLLSRIPTPFCERLQELHDRSGQASCHLPVTSERDAAARDQPAIQSQSQRRAGDRSAAGSHAADGASGQDLHRPGAAAASLPGM